MTEAEKLIQVIQVIMANKAKNNREGALTIGFHYTLCVCVYKKF